MLLFIILIFTSFIRCDDFQINLVTDGTNSSTNVVLNNLNSQQCLPNSCNNQFCSGIFELSQLSTSIHTNTLIFPHFQVASVVDVGVTNNAITNGIKNIIQLTDEISMQYTNFSMDDYSNFAVNADCNIYSYKLTYFFQALSIMNTGSDSMTTSINDYNTPVHSYIYRYQISINTCHPTCLLCNGITLNDCTRCQQVSSFSNGSSGSCSCTNSSDYFQNGQCVNSCSTNYVPNGKYCYYNYGCQTPDPSNNGKCQTCASGYYNNDGICQTQNTVPPGYIQQGSNFILKASQNPQQVQNIQYYLKAFTSYTFSDLEVTNKGFSVTPGRPQQPLVTSCKGVNILGGFMVIQYNTVIQFPSIRISTQYYQIFFTVYLIDFDTNLSPSYINVVLSDGSQLSSYTVSTNKSTAYYCGLNQMDTIDSFSFVYKIGASPSNQITKNFQIINKSSIIYAGSPVAQGYLGVRDIIVIGFDCKDPNCTDCIEYVCTSCADYYFLNSSKQCEKCFDPNCIKCSGKNQQDCISCNSVKPYFLQDDHSCTDCKLNGYYSQSNNCLKCIPNCQTCQNGSTCDLCQSGYLIHEQTNKCVICSQQSGYYSSGKYCKQCNVACKECSGPTDLDCTICNQLHFQIDTTTKRCQTCPNNAYLSSSKQNCQKCNYQCSLCDNIALSYSMLTLDQSLNSNQNFCLVCSCQQCESGYILFNQKQCTQSCESIGSNYIYNSSTNTCTCQQGYNYQVRNPYKNNFDCSNGQGYGYFCDSHNICFQCSQNCSSCSDIQTCIKCNEGSYLWQNACSQNCFPDLNIVPNTQKGICECPEGYNLEQLKSPIQGQSMICQLPLAIQSINVYNYLAQSKDITLPTDFSDNLIVITYNRKLTTEEYSSFQFLIDEGILNLGNQYRINSISIEDQNVKIIVISSQNRRVKQFTISIKGSKINYQIPNTIIVSSSYGEQSNSFASGKQLTQNLQTIQQAFSPDQNSASGKVINLLKQFQILCYISNFVQVLPMIYLIKECLPPKVNFASLSGATLVFNQTPQPTQISFESQQYNQLSNQQKLQDILKSFGIKPAIYNNFLQVQVVVLVCIFLMIYCLFFRKILKGKQYTSLIIYTIFNFLCSYLQSSLTAIVFSICYCWLSGENIFHLIFQISAYCFFFVTLVYLLYQKSGDYLFLKAPNIYGDIDFKMKGSKSYILISFFKKYFIVISFLVLFQKQFECALISCIVYGVSGLYLLYLRFFKSKIITIIKVLQEIMVSVLFIFIGITIKEMQATANEDAIPNETLLKIELLGSIIIISILICLLISTLLQLIRYAFLIQDLIKTYKKNKREKQLKQIELEALISTDLQQQLQSQQNSTFIRVSSSSITKKRLLKNSN